MKAAIVQSPGQTPIYGDFPDPLGQEGEQVITVSAAALSHLTKGRAMGTHYSSSGQYPLVPGVDGVGKLPNGQRVYFAMPRIPFGAMAEKTVVQKAMTLYLPTELDDVMAAGIANPGMSCWMALHNRAHFQTGETVLVNGATGIAGSLAVQIAKYLGAKKVIATGRNPEALKSLTALGADVTISLALESNVLEKTFQEQFEQGIHIVLDYVWGPVAERLLMAAAKANNKEVDHRYVSIGATSAGDIKLPSAVLRSIPIELMGSGLGSVPLERVLKSIEEFFQTAVKGNFKIDIRALPLSQIAEVWTTDKGNPRTVFTI